MRDVYALRTKFSRHALRKHAQSGFGCRKMGKAGFAAQAARGAGEQHGAASQRYQSPGRLASDQKSAEAANAPEVLEHLGRQFAKIQLAIVACVVGHQIGRSDAGARCRGVIEQPDDVLLSGGVHGERFRTTSVRLDGTHHLPDFFQAATCHEHMVAALGKTPAQCGTQSKLSADADHDCGWSVHYGFRDVPRYIVADCQPGRWMRSRPNHAPDAIVIVMRMPYATKANVIAANNQWTEPVQRSTSHPPPTAMTSRTKLPIKGQSNRPAPCEAK